MNRKSSGIFLVASLIMLVLVAMIVGASLSLASGSLAQAGSSSDLANAERAAESGLRYAQVRLQENPAWRGDGNGVILDGPDLYVEEDQGNVVGLVRVTGDQFSQFRLRFNYQDGPGGDDLLDDPAVTMDLRYVSVNNLLGASPLPVPLADAGGVVTSGSESQYDAPALTAVVLVEGRSGPGLGNIDSTNLFSSQVNGPVANSVSEVYFRISDVATLDAATMSAGDFKVDFGTSGERLTLSVMDKDQQTPRVRSKKTIEIVANGGLDFETEDGEARTQSGSLSANYDSTKLRVATEQASDSFYQLEQSGVAVADPSGDKLPAGTYVWWETTSGGELHYYDLNYEQYTAHIRTNPTDPGTVGISLPSSLNASGTRLTLVGDLYIEPTSSGTVDFTLIPRSGAAEDPPTAAAAGGFSSQGYVDGLVAGGILTPGQLWGWSSSQPILSEFFASAQMGPGHPSISAGTTLDGAGPYEIIPGLTIVNPGTNNQSTSPFGYSIDPSVIPAPTVEEALLYIVENTTCHNSYFAGADPDPSNGTNWDGQAAQWGVTVSGGALDEELQELDLGSVTDNDNLDVNQTQLHFAPSSGEAAILSSDGDIRIGGGIFGEGGSITAGGQIRISGLGTDLSANPNGEEGVSLYAVDDIVISALKPSGTPGEYIYGDFNLSGIIYTQKDFQAKLGLEDPSVTRRGNLAITGALVAYGGDPSGNPGTNGGGNITVNANRFDLTYDPAYISNIDQNVAGVKLRQTLRHTHR